MKNEFKLVGHTVIKVNDEVVFDKKNTIANNVKEYLAEAMHLQGLSLGVKSIGTNNGFFVSADGGATPDASGKGGIVVGSQPIAGVSGDPTIASPLAMVTTDITNEAVNQFGARWRGTMTAQAAVSVRRALLGEQWNGSNNNFDVNYASQNFQTVTLAEDDTLTIEWEIAIV